MKQKTYPTSPPRRKYRIWDVDGGHKVVFESEDLETIYAVYRTTYKNVFICDHPYYERHLNKPKYIITNEYNDEISFDDLKEKFHKRKVREPRSIAPYFAYKKGNPDKIKRGFFNWSYWSYLSGGERWHEYPYKTDFFRAPKTMNERRQNEGVTTDMGPEFVRPRRNTRNLPDTWSDLSNATAIASKSWKHHSKRRKQWKPKRD